MKALVLITISLNVRASSTSTAAAPRSSTTSTATGTKQVKTTKPTSLYKATDYYTKIVQPSQCYGGHGLDVYESFNATDMGFETPETG